MPFLYERRQAGIEDTGAARHSSLTLHFAATSGGGRVVALPQLGALGVRAARDVQAASQRLSLASAALPPFFAHSHYTMMRAAFLADISRGYGWLLADCHASLYGL